MKKKWMTVFCAVLFTILVISAADTKAADEAGTWKEETEVHTEGDFTYYIHPSQNGTEAWLYKIEINGKSSDSLSIPETILDKKVTRLGVTEYGSEEDELDDAYATLFGTYIEPWHNWDGSNLNPAAAALKSIQIPDTVEAIDRASFSGLNSLTSIRLPQNLKKIEGHIFYGCDKLKTVILPEPDGVFREFIAAGMPFPKKDRIVQNEQNVQGEKKLSDPEKDNALMFAAATGKKFTIPSGVKKITSYAFRSATASVIHIPASVTKIEGKAFNMFDMRENANIKDVTISKKNSAFARDGQCIYKKSNKSLAVAIPNKKGELRISEKVKKLTPDISVVNCDTTQKSLKKVVYPKGLKHVIVPGLTAINARNVYFTGTVPPKVTDPNKEIYGKLPVFCHIYVPKAHEAAYKSWYKKYDCYRDVSGWHTYNP